MRVTENFDSGLGDISIFTWIVYSNFYFSNVPQNYVILGRIHPYTCIVCASFKG